MMLPSLKASFEGLAFLIRSAEEALGGWGHNLLFTSWVKLHRASYRGVQVVLQPHTHIYIYIYVYIYITIRVVFKSVFTVLMGTVEYKILT